jgi:glycosyltransferase involved in cell wall biosynthesis
VTILYLGEHGRLERGWRRLYARHAVNVEVVSPASVADDGGLKSADALSRRLLERAPDVVVLHEWRAPGFASLRTRHEGGLLQGTVFVTCCHGSTQWLVEAAERAPDDAESVLIAREREAVEMSDVVISPSKYLAVWMKDAGWKLPRGVRVVPNASQSSVWGSRACHPRHDPQRVPVKRIAFFGRLEDRKGLPEFVAALRRLDPRLLRGVGLSFVGRASQFNEGAVRELLDADLRRRLSTVEFSSNLSRERALRRLDRDDTLVVIPSKVENAPCVVVECIERGIPFLASRAGGTPELIAEADAPEVLVEPTSESIGAALQRALLFGARRASPSPSLAPPVVAGAWREIVDGAWLSRSHSTFGHVVR